MKSVMLHDIGEAADFVAPIARLCSSSRFRPAEMSSLLGWSAETDRDLVDVTWLDSHGPMATSAIRHKPPLNFARIDLVSLNLVLLCSEAHSLSAAAPQANMAVSTASHRLNGLEQSLGVSLFVRQRRGLVPTEAGNVVVSHARLILRLVESLNRDLNQARHTIVTSAHGA